MTEPPPDPPPELPPPLPNRESGVGAWFYVVLCAWFVGIFAAMWCMTP